MSGIVMMERSLAPQWKAIAVIVVSMFACLLMGIAVVQSMDTAVYDSLPPAMLALAWLLGSCHRCGIRRRCGGSDDCR